MRDLNKKRISELTQEAARLRTEEKKQLEVSHKDVMKKGKHLSPRMKAKPSAKTNKKKTNKGPAETRTKELKEIDKKKPTGKVSEEKGQKKSNVKEQGGGKRKIPEAGDKHGCDHHGLLELIPLPKAYLEAYVRVGGWLHENPCKDCAQKEGDGKERVLDVSTLLELKGKKDVGYYCNSGPAGHRMGKDEEWRHHWTCDMVLCLDCYARRMTSMGSCKRTRRRKQL